MSPRCRTPHLTVCCFSDRCIICASRQRAVSEAARILKPGAVLYAAGINRLPYFRDLFRESPYKAVQRREFHERFLRDGNVDPHHAAPLGFGHLSTVAEFRELFADQFRAAPADGG
jgi:hypothetical protein